jgi:hypothetical protein
VSARQLPVRLEAEPEFGTEKRVPALVTVYAPIVGQNDPTPVTETFPAVVRTRLTWRGRPAFLAADPEAGGSS